MPTPSWPPDRLPGRPQAGLQQAPRAAAGRPQTGGPLSPADSTRLHGRPQSSLTQPTDRGWQQMGGPLNWTVTKQ